MISKTMFLNYIRCPRFCALEEIYRKKEDSIVSIEGLIELEENAKKQDLINSMYDEDDEDLIAHVDMKLETLLPYYRKIEILAGNAIKKMFGGNVIYGLNTYNQKRFDCLYGDYRFYCFLDGYQEDEFNFNVFETKATTDKKFMDLGYSFKKEKYTLFEKNENGILTLKEKYDPTLLENEKYLKCRSKFFDKYSDVGKYIYDLAFQRFVIEKSGDKTNLDNAKYYLVVLNSEYIFDGKLSETDEPIYDESIITFIDFTDITKELIPILEKDFKLVEYYLDTMEAKECRKGEFCQRKKLKQCKFFDICYKDVPKYNSVFSYIGGHNGFGPDKLIHTELVNEKIYSMQDVPYEWLTRKINIIQRNCVDTHEIFINKNKIIDGLNTLKYPIYHLDFESFPCPLPRYKGENPYIQSVFQFSLHVEKKESQCDKELDHYEFLATDHLDQREEMIKKMIEYIKDDGGTVLVYNQSFEKTRLKELARIFPQYKKELDNINDRVFDLLHLIKGNKELYLNLGYDKEEASEINYYHENLYGSYSIKKVLPIFSDLTYDTLDVKNGNDAQVTYARFIYMDEEEYKQKYNSLLEYCKQDTWAMFEVLEGLRRLVKTR